MTFEATGSAAGAPGVGAGGSGAMRSGTVSRRTFLEGNLDCSTTPLGASEVSPRSGTLSKKSFLKGVSDRPAARLEASVPGTGGLAGAYGARRTGPRPYVHCIDAGGRDGPPLDFSRRVFLTTSVSAASSPE